MCVHVRACACAHDSVSSNAVQLRETECFGRVLHYHNADTGRPQPGQALVREALPYKKVGNYVASSKL